MLSALEAFLFLVLEVSNQMGQCTNILKLQKHSAGLTAMTERTLGAKAGHLELLKGGKKNKDTKEGEVPKGGSKKFG